ncbi:tetratricopeptide repeat protein [Streptomyces sp. NBC_00481]|nr:tetratricopeptide repeat protein [Streptomyces sp. NBC_00481]WRY95646.1 tetratricopeptide repeat protein [Streptomyces sp. NBC_00481]
MDRLLPRLAPARDEDTAPLPLLISAVTGMGGIGKTALAVEAAHRARAEGWFPGGTLFVDLRGYDDNPVTADQAVLALLDALGVRDGELPERIERQYDAYRALLTERQDRILLILDNASDPSQYLPLLPGTDQHRVLITSRNRPYDLPVRIIDLEALDPDESVALISGALHDSDERDDRPAREEEALGELTALCGHLPLALQIAAAMLRRRRYRGIASLVAEIKKAENPTVAFDKGRSGTDLYGRSLALSPVLETSYRRLPPDQARLLCLLSLAPGSETTTEAVAALIVLDTDSTLSLLEDLAATHLVASVQNDKEATSMPRWRLHDLVRAFGTGMVAADKGLWEEGQAARERVLEFYYRWAAAADDRLRWLPGMEEPEQFSDRAEALAWFDREREGLVAAVLWAREERFADTAVLLAECLGEYLSWRRYFDDGITVSRAAQEAAQRAGSRLGEAGAWNNLGIALREAGRMDEAMAAHIRARDLLQAAGNRHGEAMAWNSLGIALLEAGRADEAVDALIRARNLCQAAGNHHGEARAWNNLGNALQEAGRMDEAIAAHIRARDLYQAAGNRQGEARAWNNLGLALQETGRVEEAIKAYDKDLEVCQEFEDWYGAGQTLENLALAYDDAHRPMEARAHYLRAADAFTRANATDRATQARAYASSLEKP